MQAVLPLASHYRPMGWLPLLCPRSQNNIQQTWCQRDRKQLDPSKARHPWQDTVGLKLGSSKTQMVSKQLENPADLSNGRMRGFQHEKARGPSKPSLLVETRGKVSKSVLFPSSWHLQHRLLAGTCMGNAYPSHTCMVLSQLSVGLACHSFITSSLAELYRRSNAFQKAFKRSSLQCVFAFHAQPYIFYCP